MKNKMKKEREPINILFLDYDGVVNTPMWDATGKKCTYNFPSDNKVNNFQAVQWVSEFCEKFKFSIVVTSTWRMHENWEECLINGGLRKSVEIIGRTDIISHNRAKEIQDYLNKHDWDTFLIFDDEKIKKFSKYQIKCNDGCGFCKENYVTAVNMFSRHSVNNEWSYDFKKHFQ